MHRQRTSELRLKTISLTSAAKGDKGDIETESGKALTLSPLTTNTEIGRTSVLDILIKINVEGKRKGSHSPLRRKRSGKKNLTINNERPNGYVLKQIPQRLQISLDFEGLSFCWFLG